MHSSFAGRSTHIGYGANEKVTLAVSAVRLGTAAVRVLHVCVFICVLYMCAYVYLCVPYMCACMYAHMSIYVSHICARICVFKRPVIV